MEEGHAAAATSAAAVSTADQLFMEDRFSGDTGADPGFTGGGPIIVTSISVGVGPIIRGRTRDGLIPMMIIRTITRPIRRMPSPLTSRD